MNTTKRMVTAVAIATVMALTAQAQTTAGGQGANEREEPETLRDYAIVCSSYKYTRVMINGGMAITPEDGRKETNNRLRGARHLGNTVAQMIEHLWRPLGGIERAAMGGVWQWCQTLVR